jgi:hypothetical protein
MLRASARALQNRGMDGLGAVPRPLAPLAERLVRPINALPSAARAEIYRRASGSESIPPAKLHRVSAEAIDRWMVECYSRNRTYVGAIVGSSSGAIAHLAAALGIPFLPQPSSSPSGNPRLLRTSLGTAWSRGAAPRSCCSTPTRSGSSITCTIPTRTA